MNKKTALIAVFMLLVVAYLLLSPRLGGQQPPLTETPPNVVGEVSTGNTEPQVKDSADADMRESAEDAPGMDDVPPNADVASAPASEPKAEDDKPMELPPAEGQ